MARINDEPIRKNRLPNDAHGNLGDALPVESLAVNRSTDAKAKVITSTRRASIASGS